MIGPDAKKDMDMHLDAIWVMLETWGDETSLKLAETIEASKKKDSIENELRDAEQKLMERLQEIETERLEAEQELEDLKKTVQRSQTDVSALQGQKAAMLIEYNQWADKVTKFKVYEEKARKLLKNEDQALQVRERAVAEKEQFKPHRTSFLPSDE